MQKSTDNVSKSPKVCTLIGNRGRRIEWRCLSLHQKFINNRFRACACAVQMLLKMVVNAAICSTFEVQYGKSTSARTTALRHLGHVISRMRRISYVFKTGRALFSQITLIIFFVEPPKWYSEQANRCRGFQKCNRFHPLLTGHVIRRTRSGRVRIFNANQWEPL